MTVPRGSSATFRRSLPNVLRPGWRPGRAGRAAGPAPGFRATPALLLRTLLPYSLAHLREYRGPIAASMVLLAIGSALKFVPPIVTKLAVDVVFSGHPVPLLLRPVLPDTVSRVWWLALLGGAVALSSLGGIGASVLGQWLIGRIAIKLQLTMRRQLFERSLSLPLHRFYELKSGGLQSVLREDTNGLPSLLRWGLANLWTSSLQLAACLVLLVWIDRRLLLGTLVLTPIMYLSRRLWNGRMLPLEIEARRQREVLDGRVTERLAAVRIVRAFDTIGMESRRFAWYSHLIARHELLALWYIRAVEMIWGVVIPGVLVALLVFGGTQVLSGRLTLGDLMMFLFCLTMLLEPVSTVANGWASCQVYLAQLSRCVDLADEPEEARPAHGVTVTGSDVGGRIELANVSFQYPGAERPTLADINLTIEPGEIVALVGSSGAGKTTLCNLIARFYRPTSGTITLDGVDLNAIDVASYRSLLGVVDQDVILFDGTVAENIAYGMTNVNRAEIRRVAEMADAHAFISAMRDGYDTVVGERGAFMSGGQRQRVAIARTLLRNPRILILDEATSDLDAESELRIQGAGLTRNRTCIIIAHALNTVRDADRIIVLEQGRIVESGTHRKLAAQSGRYRALLDAELQIAAPDPG